MAYTFGRQLDEIHIFNQAIDSAAVSQLYNDTLVITGPGSFVLIGLGAAFALLRRGR